MNHSSELVLFSELVTELWKQFDSDRRPMSRLVCACVSTEHLNEGKK